MVEIDALSIEDYKTRRAEITLEEDKLRERKCECEDIIFSTGAGDVSYKEVKQILHNLAPLLQQQDAEKLNVLMHLLIDKIEITENKQIESIHISLNDSLKAYTGMMEDVPQGASSFSFCERSKTVVLVWYIN